MRSYSGVYSHSLKPAESRLYSESVRGLVLWPYDTVLFHNNTDSALFYGLRVGCNQTKYVLSVVRKYP